LMTVLQKKFGVKSVLREDSWVDITVKHNKRVLLIELKTDPVAKRAIREALGQILEYAYIGQNKFSAALSLFIVAPGPMDEAAAQYLSLLNTQFGLPITYCQFRIGDNLPKPFLALQGML
jgi:hypothetical protein